MRSGKYKKVCLADLFTPENAEMRSPLNVHIMEYVSVLSPDGIHNLRRSLGAVHTVDVYMINTV